MGSMAGTLTAEPETSSEGVLAEMLAGVMKIEQVPFDSHFFDDLGADSLVMAKFCARVRKREGLPVMSMQDIYAHPSIRRLAQAFGIAEAEAEGEPGRDSHPDPAAGSDPGPVRGAGAGQHAAVPRVRGAAAAVLPRIHLGGRDGRRPGVRVDIGRPGLRGRST